MPFSIYQASVPVYSRQLKALSAILDKAAAYASQRKIDPAVLIQARLYPDMLPFARQVQIACSHAIRGSARLSGAEPMSLEDKASSFEDLKALIAKTLEFVKGVDAQKMEGMEYRDITFPAGDRKITLKGAAISCISRCRTSIFTSPPPTTSFVTTDWRSARTIIWARPSEPGLTGVAGNAQTYVRGASRPWGACRGSSASDPFRTVRRPA